MKDKTGLHEEVVLYEGPRARVTSQDDEGMNPAEYLDLDEGVVLSEQEMSGVTYYTVETREPRPDGTYGEWRVEAQFAGTMWAGEIRKAAAQAALDLAWDIDVKANRSWLFGSR